MHRIRLIRGRAALAGLAVAGLVLMALSALASGGARDAYALANCDVGDYSLDGEEQAFLSLVNNYRQQNGLNALTVSTNLNRAAHWMSNDLGTNGYFSHTDSLGRSPYARAIDCGYPQGAGENLAAGTAWDSAQAAFDAWKASPGHNANMLGQYYLQIGIARVFVSGSQYGWYWTTNFGSTDDGTGGGAPPPPTATPTNTPQPPAATPTNTPVAPTATPTNTPAPNPGATNTPAPQPTNTPTPAPATTPRSTGSTTPTATPTATPKPPTPTTTPSAPQPKSPAATPTPPAGSLPLSPGANLVGWPGEDADPEDALKPLANTVAMVYRWDALTGSWQRYAPGLPKYVNTLDRMLRGEAYWVITK